MAWLKCEALSPGQFSDELAATFNDYRGKGVSLFAPRDCFLDDGTKGSLRVEVVQEFDELRLIRLPVESLNGSYFVTVKEDQLR